MALRERVALPTENIVPALLLLDLPITNEKKKTNPSSDLDVIFITDFKTIYIRVFFFFLFYSVANIQTFQTENTFTQPNQ